MTFTVNGKRKYTPRDLFLKLLLYCSLLTKISSFTLVLSLIIVWTVFGCLESDVCRKRDPKSL